MQDSNKTLNKKTGPTVLVAMTGRVDSTISAFLLKRQGYRVIGIGINLFDPNENRFLLNRLFHGGDEFAKDETDHSVDYLNELLPKCHISHIKNIKDVCEQLEISFYGVNAYSMYRDKVVNQSINAKLSGAEFFPCSNCHEIIFEILLEKLKVLKADYIATGHYSKVVFAILKSFVGNILDFATVLSIFF